MGSTAVNIVGGLSAAERKEVMFHLHYCNQVELMVKRYGISNNELARRFDIKPDQVADLIEGRIEWDMKMMGRLEAYSMELQIQAARQQVEKLQSNQS